ARALLTVAGALLASAGCGGSPAPDDAPRIAFLFDGSWGEADEVAGPTLAGLRFAALDTGDPETIQPVNLGEGLAILREVAADPNVVATVVAPWTAAPPAATGLLVETEMPVVSLAWAWGRPSAEAPWIRLAPDLATEAELLLAAGAPATPRCTVGDRHPTSGPLATAVRAAAGRTGATVQRAGVVDERRSSTADAAAARLTASGCRSVLWTGGAAALDLLVEAAPDLRSVIGTSRVKTEGGIGVGATHPVRTILATCPCADVTLARDPALQRFVHDFQSESGSAPGPFAVEAYDVGRWLLRVAREGGRSGVREALTRAGAVDGLLGTYRIGTDGSLLSSPAPAGTWRAFGSRWLPVEQGHAPPLPIALLVGRVLARVPRRTRPRGARARRTREGR
ncbi:MAG TPA: hypothetical protein VF108_04555, partial [Actinomycetota bacterium]